MHPKPKVYVAGPDVFLGPPFAVFQRDLCTEFGFTPLHPSDNDIDGMGKNLETALYVYKGNIKQIKACNILVANCNPFESPFFMDPQTSNEMGYAAALNKVVYGYMEHLEPIHTRILRHIISPVLDPKTGTYSSRRGYRIEDLGTATGVMMHGNIVTSGGRLIEGNFEDCLRAIRQDIDSHILNLYGQSDA